MARWTASGKWAEGPALDGQCAMPLGLRLSEGLGVIRAVTGSRLLYGKVCWLYMNRIPAYFHSGLPIL